jgi:type VII secretion protein EccB
MYGRREQVEAHSFLTGRITAAVLRTDPDSSDRPLRRTTVGMAGGIGVAILVVAIVLIVTLFTDRTGDSWREPGTLIVEEDSGNRYLLINNQLRPVLNYASARLLVQGNPPVVSVTADDLSDVPKGAPVGIMGAPDTLPPPQPTAQPWTVCAGATEEDPDVAVTVGDVPGVRAVGEGEALLVRNGDQVFLAWQENRLRITAAWVPRALGLDPSAAVQVDSAWLNTLPAGPDLGAPPVEHGGPGPNLGGRFTTTGQLVTVPEAVGDNDFVVAADGLLPVSETVAALLRADPDTGQQPEITLTPAQLATQQVLPAPVWQADLPAKPPVAMDIRSSVPCVRWESDRAALVAAPAMIGSTQDSDPAGVTRDGRVADVVDVAPGAGVLARTRPAPGVPGAGVYLITEAGAKFPVGSSKGAEALGFSVAAAVLVPAELLALLPTGPTLDVLK